MGRFDNRVALVPGAVRQQVDVADEAQVSALIKDTLARFGKIDVLCNITGQALAVDGGNSASLHLPGMKV